MDSYTGGESAACCDSNQCPGLAHRPSSSATAPMQTFMVSVSGNQLPFSVVYKEESDTVNLPANSASLPANDTVNLPSNAAGTTGEDEEKAEAKPAASTADSAYNSGHENTPEQLEAAQQQAKSKPAPPTITVLLSEEELWKAFHKVGNEMIVTKPGR